MTCHDMTRFAGIELKGETDDTGDDPAAIITKSLDDLRATVDERLKPIETKTADLAKIADRLDKIELKVNRPAGTPEKKADEQSELERKAFGLYLRGGRDALGEVERKTLTVSSDPNAGYLAPPEFSTEFLRDLVEFSPIRSIASVRSTGNPSVRYPRRTGITNARWHGEAQAQTESEPTFGQLEVTVREVGTYVDVSNQLLQDSGGTAEAEVRTALAEDFGQKEGKAFVSGDGVLAPMGVMTDPGIAYTPNGHATNLSADALITLMYALPALYRNRGTWLMNGATLATIRKLKDGQNNYLWQPSFQAGQPETILGRPVVEAVDMPDIASGAFPIIYGDFNTGYRIVDRVGLSVLVNPYLLATNGITRFHATRRVGGGVIAAAALRKLKMATS